MSYKLCGADWSQIHQRESPGPLSPFLAVLSVLYGIGVRFRLLGYRLGLFKRKSLPAFVASIGNLSTGGTGKTPAVVMLANWALGEGYRVAVLSRGYGGRYRAKVLEVSDGKRIKANFQEVGDEPYLLARKLPGIPVVISKKRFLAGTFAHKRFGCDFLILDDGFQHLQLKRDLDLALIDAGTPFGNSHMVPWGPLREPLGQLCRAHAFIVTRFRGDDASKKTLHLLERKFPAMRVHCADHLADKVVFPYSDENHNPEYLKGKAVVAFAGIGRPEVFKDTLVELGTKLVYFKGFRDHYRFNKEEIDALIHVKEKLGADYLLTTEKDWVRMAHLAPDCRDLAYLSIKFVILSGEDEFFRMIKDGMRKARN